MKRCCLDDLASWIDVSARTLQGTTMANDLSAVPDVLFGTWKQLSGTYVDLETGEERPGLSKSPSGYIHLRVTAGCSTSRSIHRGRGPPACVLPPPRRRRSTG